MPLDITGVMYATDNLNKTLNHAVKKLDKRIGATVKAFTEVANGLTSNVTEILAGFTNNITSTFNHAVHFIVDTVNNTTRGIVESESQRLEKWYAEVANACNTAKEHFSYSAKTALGGTFITNFVEKFAYGIASRLRRSESISEIVGYILGAVANLAYQSYMRGYNPKLIIYAFIQLVSPFLERRFKTRYSPTTAIALANILKTGLEIYTNPIEGVANIAGTAIGNGGGALAAELVMQAIGGGTTELVIKTASASKSVIISTIGFLRRRRLPQAAIEPQPEQREQKTHKA